ncbi:MAG: hypothetical protein DRP71_10425 [Verrucomicrobia bacterium]|nr:MAG: hypothetical protein DRP71_10425 [Verrucomicrobiota bacterium]
MKASYRRGKICRILVCLCALTCATATSLIAQTFEPGTEAWAHRDRVERALAKALDGDLREAEAIATEDLPALFETPDETATYASRMAGLAFRLQNLDRDPEARAVGSLALEACSIYLESEPELTNPRRAARFLKMTGMLLQKTAGDLTQAKEAYLLAYRLDPENQVEALRLGQALEERERVIAERLEEETRREEAQR